MVLKLTHIETYILQYLPLLNSILLKLFEIYFKRTKLLYKIKFL